MTTEELNETLGYYETGFLHLKINTDEDIWDLNQLLHDKEKISFFSTFLHEYIHFLQNVTTTYGLMYCIFYIDLIKDINQTILKDIRPEFEVPVQVTNDNNIKANIQLQGIYQGDKNTTIRFAHYDSYQVEEVIVLNKDANQIKLNKYKIWYYDLSDQKRKSMYFGVICLKEYMAHTIQKEFDPNREHYDIPYLIVELILEKEYPILCSNVKMIVALCDACLMSTHPAEMFFSTFERMKEENFIPQSVKEIYDFSFTNVTFNGQGMALTPLDLFDKFIKLADKQFSDALKSEIFKPNYLWINHILQEANKIRRDNIGFITELIDNEGKISNTFYQIIQNFGTPFFTNRKGEGGFAPPLKLKDVSIQPYQLLTFSQVMKIYFGSKTCKLLNFCKSSPPNDITNHYCETSPWKRANEAELCSFAQIWKTWGLMNKTPVPKA